MVSEIKTLNQLLYLAYAQMEIFATYFMGKCLNEIPVYKTYI